ncbi:MAG: hypothetical protein F4X36_02385 [Gammaproteobacteria bacterium]|nr:hypothetical protein [Gammaproteobacteria bacterium]
MLAFLSREEGPDAFVEGGSSVEKAPVLELKPVERSWAVLTDSKPSWVDSTLKQLGRISELREDWDSYGARIITKSRIPQVYSLIQSVMDDRAPAPTLIPTPDGSIQVEWHSYEVELEVLLTSDADLEVVFEDLRGEVPAFEGVLRYDVAPLVEYVRLLAVRAQGGEDG